MQDPPPPPLPPPPPPTPATRSTGCLAALLGTLFALVLGGVCVAIGAGVGGPGSSLPFFGLLIGLAGGFVLGFKLWKWRSRRPLQRTGLPGDAPLSPDGRFWWDGHNWVRVVPGPTYAFFGLRFWAYLIDSLVISPPSFVYAIIFLRPYYYALFHHQPVTANTYGVELLGSAIIGAIASSAYFITMWTRRGQTLGMRAVGIECVGETSAKPLPVDRAIVRSLFFWLPQLVGELVGIGALSAITLIAFLWVAFDTKKQGLHDKAAGSIVMMNRRPRGMGEVAVVLVTIVGWTTVSAIFALIVSQA